METEGRKTAERKKKRRNADRVVVSFFFLASLLLLSAGFYTAWTTYYDNDLVEPFVCSYAESDMHAREVAAAFKDIVNRAEHIYSQSNTFFSGYVDFGYCVKLTEEEGGKIFSNLSYRTSSFGDENIMALVKEKYYGTENISLKNDVTEEPQEVYEDCYWWEPLNKESIFYNNYWKSRVKVPEILLKSKKVEKIGICFSRDVLSKKEEAWRDYATFMYFITALLVLGGVLSLYFGKKILSWRKFPAFLKRCFWEVPVLLMLVGIVYIILCYEHKISVFVSQNRMDLLQSSSGSVQLAVSMFIGALVLTGGFLAFFLGLYIMAAMITDKETESISLIGKLYDKYNRDEKGREIFEKIKKPLKRKFLKVLKGWKFFWGLFTGESIHVHTIADRERKRVLLFALMMVLIFLGECSYFYLPDVTLKAKGRILGVCLLLTAVFLFVFLLGSMRNIMEYVKMEHMIEKVHEGDYQGLSVKEEGISKRSVCYPDAVKLEQIGSGFQKAVEDQIHAEKLKMELLTNVSHDLKTPLTSIISYIELLGMEQELSAEAKEYIIILKKKAERLKTIISEVFELAKATSGEIQIEKKEIDFYRLTVQTLADMQDRIDSSGLVIKENLVKDHVMIYSDGERLYRVLQNLIDNALKYSLKGTRIYLDLVSDKKELVFTIKNIAGYEMKFEAGDITERFVRGDKNRTTEGSGLGLSIAQGFTIACGGKFQVVVDGDMFKVILRFPVIEPEGK